VRIRTLVLIILAACSMQSTSVEWLTLTEPHQGFAIRYPVTWHAAEAGSLGDGRYQLLLVDTVEDNAYREHLRVTGELPRTGGPATNDIFVTVYQSQAQLPWNTANEAFRVWATQRTEEEGYLNRAETMIAGRPAIQWKGSQGGGVIVMFEAHARIYELTTSMPATEIQQDIFASFRLL
jgi:hypothetical protein